MLSPDNPTVMMLFEQQVQRQPSATAIVSDAGRVTYAELNARANQLARYLRSAGATAETCVGVCMERGVHLVTALLAVLKAGAAYVPMIDHDPPERIRQMAVDARVRVVITDRTTEERVAACGLDAIAIGRYWPAIARESASDLEEPVHAEQLAYAIYTSGSTGRPKAVAIAHVALTNVLGHLREMLQVVDADRWLAVTPITFDIAAVELFLPLIAGAQVWIAGKGENGDGRAMRRRLAASRATIMQATPVTWQFLIVAGWTGDPAFRVLTGGDALSPSLAAQLAARASNVWNVYGPTETAIWSSAWRVDVDDAQPAVSLGEPIANTQLSILDGDMRPQPAGTPGELYISGAGLARGYLHQPALTATRFLPDPLAAQPGGRMYRTGDWVRYVDASKVGDRERLEYLGRTDHQVKLRGVRIECGEVESMLRELPSIRSAAVVVRNDAAGHPRLIAFIVRDTGADNGATPGTHAALQNFLRGRLPEVMVPSAFVDLEELPLTAHGKINRDALSWSEPPPRVGAN